MDFFDYREIIIFGLPFYFRSPIIVRCTLILTSLIITVILYYLSGLLTGSLLFGHTFYLDLLGNFGYFDCIILMELLLLLLFSLFWFTNKLTMFTMCGQFELFFCRLRMLSRLPYQPMDILSTFIFALYGSVLIFYDQSTIIFYWRLDLLMEHYIQSLDTSDGTFFPKRTILKRISLIKQMSIIFK